MDDAARKIARRIVTVPAYGVALIVVVCAAPLAIPVAATSDVVRGVRFAATRAYLFAAVYLACEVAGIVASFGLWLAARTPLAGGEAQQRSAHYAVQSWWASTLFSAAVRLFRLDVRVEGADRVARERDPFLLLVRHVSVVDTLLSAVFLGAQRGLRLRYVLKRELLWDPCLDIVGHRLPNCFIEREAQARGPEVDRIRDLARDLGPGEGVLIYPEGTRFSEARRAAVIDRFERNGQAEGAALARSLHHVLPPRLAGTLALMEVQTDADVVLCRHVGLERTMRFADVASGALVGSRVEVRFDRHEAASIPRDRAGRTRWLVDRWKEIDQWIDDHIGERSSAAA